MYKIQELQGPGNTHLEPQDINGSGDVSGVAWTTQGAAGAIWSGGSPSFSLPDSSESILYGLNSSQAAAGVRGWNNSPTQIAILVHGGVVKDLAGKVGAGSVATGINDAGFMCGWGSNDSRAFIYNSAADSVAHINPLPGTSHAIASAISETGDVVGKSDNHGFHYRTGTLTDLGLAAFVDDTNESAHVSGSIGKPWPQAFSPGVWDVSQPSPAFAEIPVPPGFLGGHATGINNSGTVVGTCWTPQTYNMNPSAYVYDSGVSVDLNALIPWNSGWHLQNASKINDKGQIIGDGLLNGRHTGFLLTPWSPPVTGGSDLHLHLPDLVWILIFGGVTVGGGGWVVPAGGGPPIPVGPWTAAWARLPAPKRDALIGFALDELAKHIEDPGARESIRRAALTAVRADVDRLIQTSSAEHESLRSASAAVRLESGKRLGALARQRRQS